MSTLYNLQLEIGDISIQMSGKFLKETETTVQSSVDLHFGGCLK